MELLTPREKDKLLIFTAALLAEQRMARGVKLNDPETVAYLCAAILEGTRDRRTAAELMSRGAMLLTRDDVIRGVPAMVAEVQVEATFPNDIMVLNASPGTGRRHADAVLRGPPQATA